jgi:hypothetical protein
MSDSTNTERVASIEAEMMQGLLSDAKKNHVS